MACWSDEVVALVRALIFDLEEDTSLQRYSDTRLKQISIVAAQMLLTDIGFNTNYSVNVTKQSITPDPTATETRDDDFINLMCLKTACIISMAEAREASAGGWAVQDGINKFSPTDRVKGLLELAKSGYCLQYVKAKDDFTVAAAVIGKAILSPINTGYYDSYYTRYYNRRF